MAKYVDYNGVKYLWQKMLAKFAPLTRALPSGGSTGYVLKKSSGTDYDVSWSAETDTKNTAGSTDTSSKIYLIGALSQAANPQTYSDNQVFAENGELSANKFACGSINNILIQDDGDGGIYIVNLSSGGDQYTLGPACSYGVGSVASSDTGLVTGGDVYTAIQNYVPSITGDLIYKGTVAAASTLLNTALKQGWVYVASADFTINSNNVQTGDMIIVNTDGTYTTQANLWAAVDLVQSNLDRMTDTDIDNAIAEAEA